MSTATGVADHISEHRLSLPPELEQLPCPRCDSTNTKFCYYNNYNLSQPRYYCKSCRRYWTRGGTIRSVPVGGGKRKSSSSSSPNKRKHSSSSSGGRILFPHEELPKYPYAVCKTVSGSDSGSGQFGNFDVNLNEAVSVPPPEALSLSSLMTTHAAAVGTGGYMPYGLSFNLDLDSSPCLSGVSFGLGLGADWPMESVCQQEEGNGGGGGGGGSGEGGSLGSDTWEAGGVEGLGTDGDCFGWPDLAISMTGKGL